MSRKHAFALSALVGVLVVAGTIAATGTIRLGGSSSGAAVSDAEIAAKTAALDRLEASLQQELRLRPAELLPPGQSEVAAAPLEPEVVYVRARAGQGEGDEGDEHEGDEHEGYEHEGEHEHGGDASFRGEDDD